MAGARKHVVFFPYPAFGHIIPLLEFAKRTAAFHNVTFIVSTTKVLEIQRKDLVTTKDQINLVALSDNLTLADDRDVGPNQITQNCKKVQAAASALLKTIPSRKSGSNQLFRLPGSHHSLEPVDFVIADFAVSASLFVCHERGIPFDIFHTASAEVFCNKLGITEDTPTCSDARFLRPENDWPDVGPNGTPEALKVHIIHIQKVMQLARGFIMNSVSELEPDAINFMHGHTITRGKPLRFVGPLVASSKRQNSHSTDLQEKVGGWLDRHSPQSVVYFSFGTTLVDVPPEQTQEIGRALLSLGKPFIWSLREEDQRHLQQEFWQKAKSQFDDANSPFLILPWAPQKTILEHRALGVFVTHCGWNSTMESIFAGVPIVAWPLFADQHPNSGIIVKLGIGVKMMDTGGRFQKFALAKEIVDAVHSVLHAKSFAEKALFWRKIAQTAVDHKGSSSEDIAAIMSSF